MLAVLATETLMLQNVQTASAKRLIYDLRVITGFGELLWLSG
jgi:hypothetical protein